MGILQAPVPIPVTNGNFPQFKFAVFSDNLTAVTTAGYLTNSNIASGFPLSNADVVMALYSYNQQTQSGTFGIFTVSIAPATGKITLTTWGNPGDAILPTTANYLAHFVNTTGTISSAAGNVIQPGNISAGLSGTAGTVSSFPAAASSGSLVLAGVANTGNTNTTISNAAMGQASVVSIPDPGASTANFLLSAAASGPQTMSGGLTISSGNLGVTSGNITASSGNIAATAGAVSAGTTLSAGTTITAGTGITSTTGGITATAGSVFAGSSGNSGELISYPPTASRGFLSIAAVANTGNTITTISNAAMGQSSIISIPDPAAASADFVLSPGALVNGNFVKASGTAGLIVDGGAALHAGTTGTFGGGATSNAFTVTGMASSWIVTASNLTSTNSVSITKVVPSTNTLTVTWSADPGAGTTVNWTAITVAI